MPPIKKSPFPQIVLKDIQVPGIDGIEVYCDNGGYAAAKRALGEMQPAEVLQVVKDSGLRGRGGAGFPTGSKWGFVPQDSPKPKYLCVNADESEPGTFKDREIMERNPHILLEGILLCSYAVGIHHAFIYCRGEFRRAFLQLEKAVSQAYAAGWLGDDIQGSGHNLQVTIHRGAGAYICGEESALLESLEGHRGMPRLRPPFPAVAGLYGCPTVINNVETLAAVPWIINNGAAEYRKHGTEKSPGTKVFSLSGHVERPGNYEVPLGTPLRQIIDDLGGGVRDGRQVKAIIPGGSSTPMFGPDQLDVAMDYESVAAAGSLVGSGGIVVIDDQTCIVEVTHRLTDFYREESCGKCTPCRIGTDWMSKLLWKMESGHGEAGDIDLLLDVADNIGGKAFCPLGDAAVAPPQSAIKLFRAEFEYHVEHHRCLVGGRTAREARLQPVSA